MSEGMLEKLKAIDPAFLTDVVRQDQNDPSFEITTWDVKRLSDKGIANPDGLWLFSGMGTERSGARPWTVVLKVFDKPEQESPMDDRKYWKREVLFAQSEIAKNMPGPLRAPHFYRIDEQEDQLWLWIEHIQTHRPNPWTLDDYAFAAHQLGQWNGACMTQMPLPVEPWFTRQHYRSWYANTNPEQDFQFPLNQKYIFGEIRDRYERLWTEREMFYRVSETLPQTFSHFDSQRRNLFIRKGSNNQDELVLIDWGLCGFGPLGAELFALIGMSAALLEWSPSELVELDKATFGNYLKGLVESGWSGNADMIRLAYTAWETVFFGIVFPNITALWCTPDSSSFAFQQFGFVEEELFLKWLPLLHYSLDCADEARTLIKKLQLP